MPSQPLQLCQGMLKFEGRKKKKKERKKERKKEKSTSVALLLTKQPQRQILWMEALAYIYIFSGQKVSLPGVHFKTCC